MNFIFNIIQIGLVCLVAGAGLLGLIALISPRLFVAVSTYGNSVLNSNDGQSEDRWFDIDEFIHSHARLFGVLATSAAGFVWFVSNNGPEAYSKSFTLIVVTIALMAGISALVYMRCQSRAIATRSAEANTDSLTGLCNRRMFDVELTRRLSQHRRQGTPLCLMIIDVDDFKSINDAYGHQVGDDALKNIGSVLTAQGRDSDIVARIGGDEFAVILPGSDLNESSVSAGVLAKAISDRPIGVERNDHTVTVSIGLAEAGLDDDTISLLRRADSVLYAAKEAGRNRCYRQGSPEPAVPTPC